VDSNTNVVTVTVEDEGEGFEPSQVPKPRSTRKSLEANRTRDSHNEIAHGFSRLPIHTARHKGYPQNANQKNKKGLN
jgi:hypothetical protein